MSDPNQHLATTALELLADAAARRSTELNNYDTEPSHPDSDEECDTDSPWFDSYFENGGSAAIHQMTNFNAPEFQRLWNHVSNFVLSNYNVGRGRRSDITGKDALFMTLTAANHATKWDFLGRLFKLKGPTIERPVKNFVKLVADHVYMTFVEDVCERHPMKRIIDQKRTFKTYSFARYATDVTFQQTNRPAGNHQESKKYFSGKHKLYGYKSEVSVLPNGLAMNCTKHYPGSLSDIDILYRNCDFHLEALKKRDDEKDITDVAHLVEKYPYMWAVIFDKGYQGATEILRSVIPKKKPRNGFLTISEEEENKKIASDRIIVENFFGRLCSLWSVMADKYRWCETFYDSLFRFCVAITNAHISLHPLRVDDYEFFQRYKNRQYSIGEQIILKRKKKQEKYRAKRKRRMSAQFREFGGSSDETVEP